MRITNHMRILVNQLTKTHPNPYYPLYLVPTEIDPLGYYYRPSGRILVRGDTCR